MHYTGTPRMLLLSLNVNIFRMNIKNIRDIFSYVCKDVCPCQDSDFLFLMSLLMLLFQVASLVHTLQLPKTRSHAKHCGMIWCWEKISIFPSFMCVSKNRIFMSFLFFDSHSRRRRFSMLGFIEISNNMILAHNSTLSKQQWRERDMGWLLQYRVESRRKKCERFDKWLGFNNKSRNFCAFMTRFFATWKSFFSASLRHSSLIERCIYSDAVVSHQWSTSRVDRMPFFSTLSAIYSFQ